MRIFAKVPNINFMAQRRAGLWVSSLLSVGVILMLLAGSLHLGRNLNFGIDFTGGVLVEVVYPQSVELDSVRQDLNAGGYHNPIVQYFGGTQDVLIRLAPEDKANSSAISANVLQALGAEQKGVQLRRIEFVGPQVGDELTVNGSLAMVFAFIGIALYIMFRFEWKFAVGAIAALIHDALMVLGFLWIFQVEFDLTTLAAILALIGYSNNETIVIFDRVRENLINQRKGTIYDIVNLSVNQTLLRSVITHVKTLLVCTALFLLGGPSVHSFSISMIVGVIVATYSSIYVSTGLAVALGVSREDLLPPEVKEIDEMP